MIRKRVVVTGRVQGVGFRWTARETATALGISGFAANRADGSVETEIEGPSDSVEEMLAWLAEGPPSAHVEATLVTDIDPVGEEGFRIVGRQ